MKKIMFAALVAAFGIGITGCQTRITGEKYPEQVLPIQKVVKVNGEDQVITEHYQIASGGWSVTARSPLYATEALEGLDFGVGTNGFVHLALAKYNRDLSTNATVMVDGMFKNGANLVIAIGDAYTKIAGGGAQADTALASAAKIYNFFTSKGGNPDKATVSVNEANKNLVVTDGTTCVECTADGTCTECTTGACTDGSCAPAK